MADPRFDDRRASAVKLSRSTIAPAYLGGALIGSLVACLAATWPAGHALAAESESDATGLAVASDYEQKVASEAEDFRPSGVPSEGLAATGRAEIAEPAKPSNRDQVDQIKAAVSAALGEPLPSAGSVPTRREQLRELVVETPIPDSLQGDQYIGELRDEVSQTIVFNPAVSEEVATDGAGVVGAATEPEPVTDTRTYQVQPGDSLWKIAEALLGDGYQWAAIYDANRNSLIHKDVLSVGQRLTIPKL